MQSWIHQHQGVSPAHAADTGPVLSLLVFLLPASLLLPQFAVAPIVLVTDSNSVSAEL